MSRTRFTLRRTARFVVMAPRAVAGRGGGVVVALRVLAAAARCVRRVGATALALAGARRYPWAAEWNASG